MCPRLTVLTQKYLLCSIQIKRIEKVFRQNDKKPLIETKK